MSTASSETDQTVALFERVETLEDVASRVSVLDRELLREVVRQELAAWPSVRPRAAARILQLSEPTIRKWVQEGVLRAAEGPTTRLLIDTNVLHAVSHVVKDVRAAGSTRALLDEVYRRLVDSSWLEREDLAESLEQMRAGQGTVRIPKSD